MPKHSFEWLEKLDMGLARLARGAGALRLVFGLALEALARRGGHHELGFSSVEAYGLEQCERSARWIQQTRSMARRLQELPDIRQSVLSGRVSWSIAELMSRVATQADERVWLSAARGRTVRQMRELLRKLQAPPKAANDDGGAGRMPAGTEDKAATSRMSAGAEGAGVVGQTSAGVPLSGPADLMQRLTGALEARPSEWRLNEPQEKRTLTITADQPDVWLFECARMLIGRMDGTTAADAVLQALLFECDASLTVPEEVSLEIEADPIAERQRAWEAQLEQWRQAAEIQCEARIADAREPKGIETETLEELVGENIEALDARLRSVAEELARRDAEIGRLAESLWRADGWRRLGYATARQYAGERLGMSLSSVNGKRALARRLNTLPHVAKAVARGRMGYEAARSVTRVATQETSAAWVERAAERTVKHLRAETAAAELLVRLGGEGPVMPPTADQMAAVESLTAKVVSGRVFETTEGIAQTFATVLGAVQKSPGSVARVTLRLQVSDGTYWHYKCRERIHRRYGPGGGFLRFLCVHFIDTWKHSLASAVAYEHVYARDRFECASPVCSRHDLTPHHLKFRSRGGGEEDENLVSLCVWCHLEGIHNARLKATPPASQIRWEIGRPGHIVVEGRRRVRRRDARSAAA